MSQPIRVAVTGGAGQIAYNLLFRIGNGEVFGADQPVILQILEIPPAMEALRGVVMELEDCAQPLLHDIVISSDPTCRFQRRKLGDTGGWQTTWTGHGTRRSDRGEWTDIRRAGPSAERSELPPTFRVLVVANPCNSNCLVTKANAPDIPADRFFAMTRLDENRAKAQLAQKARAQVADVRRLAIWGNHSATQFPNFEHAQVNGLRAEAVIGDRDWLVGEFMTTVQQRGAAIINARGKSSAASAANAALDTIRSLINPTADGDFISAGIPSEGNLYGVAEGLIFSFPLTSAGNGAAEIVPGLQLSRYAQDKIQATEAELLKEREAIADLL